MPRVQGRSAAICSPTPTGTSPVSILTLRCRLKRAAAARAALRCSASAQKEEPNERQHMPIELRSVWPFGCLTVQNRKTNLSVDRFRILIAALRDLAYPQTRVRLAALRLMGRRQRAKNRLANACKRLAGEKMVWYAPKILNLSGAPDTTSALSSPLERCNSGRPHNRT